MEEVDALPAEVDWAADGKVNPKVPNQGVCGSCWAFAAIGAAESALAIAHGDAPVPTLSQANLLQCAPNPEQCGGERSAVGLKEKRGENWRRATEQEPPARPPVTSHLPLFLSRVTHFRSSRPLQARASAMAPRWRYANALLSGLDRPTPRSFLTRHTTFVSPPRSSPTTTPPTSPPRASAGCTSSGTLCTTKRRAT